MSFLYQAHSGLRYLVLLAGLACVGMMLRGWLASRPFTGGSRAITAAFTGLLHLQVVLGILLLASGIWYSALIGHVATMLVAAVALPIGFRFARRGDDGRRSHGIAAGTAAGGLLLLVVGILAIRDGVLERRAQPVRPGQGMATPGIAG